MNHKILVVDDQQAVLYLIITVLEENIDDIEVFIANNGRIGFEVAKTKNPDIIITDWEMPELNGIEMIKLLKNNQETKDIPIIMATGVMTSSVNLQTALNAGASDYFRKPIDPIELIARVNSMLKLADSIKKIKKKNKEIQQSNIFLQNLINTLPEPFVFYQNDGKCIKANDLLYKMFNIKKESKNCISIYEDIDSENKKIHILKDKELVSSFKSIEYELNVNIRNKNYDIIFRKHPVLFFESNMTGIICIMHDVTTIREANKKILDNKKRELAATTLKLIQINEQTANLLEQLKTIEKHIDLEGKRTLNQLVNSFDDNITNSLIWEEFELHFSQVHKSFYDSLADNFPKLTAKERRLCALLRLNLSSKEIASITFQAPNSIDMARYRIRKKLNLNKDDNLNDFLASL